MNTPRHPSIEVKSKQSWQLSAAEVFRDEVEKALRGGGFSEDADRFLSETEVVKNSLFDLTEIASSYVTVNGKRPKKPKTAKGSPRTLHSSAGAPRADGEETSAADLEFLIQQSQKDRGVAPSAKPDSAALQPSRTNSQKNESKTSHLDQIDEALSALPVEARAPFNLFKELLEDRHQHIQVADKAALAVFFNLSTSQIGTVTRASGSVSTTNGKTTWEGSGSTRPDFLTIRNWFVAFTNDSHLICLTTNGAQLQNGSSEIVQMIQLPLAEIQSIQWGYQEGWDTRMASANRILTWFKSHPIARSVIENVSRQPWNLERVINININFGEARIASPMLDAAQKIANALETRLPPSSSSGYA